MNHSLLKQLIEKEETLRLSQLNRSLISANEAVEMRISKSFHLYCTKCNRNSTRIALVKMNVRLFDSGFKLF